MQGYSVEARSLRKELPAVERELYILFILEWRPEPELRSGELPGRGGAAGGCSRQTCRQTSRCLCSALACMYTSLSLARSI